MFEIFEDIILRGVWRKGRAADSGSIPDYGALTRHIDYRQAFRRLHVSLIGLEST